MTRDGKDTAILSATSRMGGRPDDQHRRPAVMGFDFRLDLDFRQCERHEL